MYCVPFGTSGSALALIAVIGEGIVGNVSVKPGNPEIDSFAPTLTTRLPTAGEPVMY